MEPPAPAVGIALIASRNNRLATSLLQALRQSRLAIPSCFVETGSSFAGAAESKAETAYVYLPSVTDREGMLPDLPEAESVFQQACKQPPNRFVLLASALIYGVGPGRKSLVSEHDAGPGKSGDRISAQWKSLETSAARYFQNNIALTILRTATVLPSFALLSQRLLRRFTVTLAGHDPTLQLLSLTDLAEAVLCAVRGTRPGVFNVAADGVVPLHAAIRVFGSHRVPLPRTLQRLGRPAESLEYLRYPWTVSSKKIKDELGFQPRNSSAAALQECAMPGRSRAAPAAPFDEFGMDRAYIEFYNKTLFKFLCDYYWRIEVNGLRHIPHQGPGVLVGMHRGFMPWDGVMALHLLATRTGRIPRFLTHPGVFKFPFISNFITKLGGVVACQESADRVLAGGELLGVFPEGVRGAFTLYRDAYQLLPFGRDAFVKLALRHRAPIVPFVTVGSAETFPIFAQIKSRRWTRYSQWPCLPISTFPFLPFPLPSKWHTMFLAPIHVEQRYPPEAAQDASTVKAISAEVRSRMQQAVDEMLRRRKSIFFGSILDEEELG